MRRRFATGLSILIVAVPWAPASSALRSEEVDLATWVPENVQMYTDWRPDPAAQELFRPIEEAVQRLIDSGIGEDVLQLALEAAPSRERDEIRQVVQRVIELLRIPSWPALFGHGGAFTFRLGVSTPLPEYAALCRPEDGPARLAELGRLFDGVREFAPDHMSVTRHAEDGFSSVRLAPNAEGLPLALSATLRGDVLILATSDLFAEDILARAADGGAAGSIASSSRFTKALEGLPESGFSRGFFHISGYLNYFRGFVAMGRLGVEGDREATAILDLVGRVLDELTRLDTVGWVETAGEGVYRSDSHLQFAAGPRGPGFIERLMMEQEPIGGALAYVPREATSFFATSGVRPTTVWDAILSIVRSVPDGGDALRELDDAEEHLGVDFREEVLSWIDGGFGCFSYRNAACRREVLGFLRVSDPEKARSTLGAVSKMIRKVAETRGVTIAYVPVEGFDGLYECRMGEIVGCRPVVGVFGGTIIVSSSVDAVRRSAEAARSPETGLASNPRFAALGIDPAGASDVWYMDVEHSLRGCGDLLATGGLFLAFLPEMRDTRPLLRVAPILSKLARFLHDIDVRLDAGGSSRYDASTHSLRSRTAVTYR